MSRKEFWTAVLLSSFFSALIVYVALSWPEPPMASAETELQTPPVSPLTLQDSVTNDEETNIRIYRDLSHSVVNVTSTRLRYNFWMQVVPEQGSGSGFVINRDGHIVTNNHVIENGDQIEVTLFDESTLAAKVIGRDPINDIALIKVDCPKDKCIPIPLSKNPELLVGQKVLAIGNPFGLERTLTTGIISSIGRSLESEYGILEDLIQTDAAINPGNSGGPLLNTNGEVIGVNTAIISRTGESAGIGFAVPITTVNRILPDLLEHGEVKRAWLGIVSGRAVGPRLAEILDLPVSEGFLIEQIADGSSADLAGLRGGNKRVFAGNVPLIIGGDILVEINGKPANSARDILRISQNLKPNDQVELVFYRGGEKIKRVSKLVSRRSTTRIFRF
jgi:putative serine protease PepD